jgi:type I restriction enzyme M protein
MAVVLPQGRFNNSSDQRVRRYIAERCRILAVVGLDGNTFKPHTGTKTSVLFVQKWNDDPTAGPLCPRVDDYNIFFATQRVPAKDSSGEKIIATRPFIELFDATESGKPKTSRLTEEEFFAQYDSLEAAGLYEVHYPNGKRSIENGLAIKNDYGSIEALRSTDGFWAARLREATLYHEWIADNHGHWVVRHDLFNVDGLTGDGIAEAFAEFAKKESLSFF